MQLRWRESGRSGLPFFDVKTTADLSYAQLWLLHWLQVYDWVFSLPYNEKPIDSIIQDDEKFDVWHNSYIAKQIGEARSGYSPSNKKSASQHSNVIKFN